MSKGRSISVGATSIDSRPTGSTSIRSASSDGVQPVELSNAICEQSFSDRFFHKYEGSLCLSRFGFSLLGAKLGRDLLIHLSAKIGLGLIKRTMGVLELLVHRDHQFAIGPLCALRPHLGLPQFLGSLPAQELCAFFSFACPVLRSAKCVGGLIHEIEGGRVLVRFRCPAGKLVDIRRKLIRPSPLLLHLTPTRN